MSELVFSCPHCGGAVQCDSQYAGQTLSCPHCQGGIIAPEAEPAAPQAEAPAEAPADQPAAEQPEPEPEQPAEAAVEEPAPPAEQPAEEKPVEKPSEVLIQKPKPKGKPVEAKDGEMLITFDCPGCGEELEIPESAIGDPVGCPDCGMEVTNAVPAPKPSSRKVVVKKKKTIVKPLRNTI